VGIAAAPASGPVKYARERKAFGVPIGEHQMIGWMLADMATAVDGARLMTLKAATLKDTGRPYTKQASMAKLFAAETADEGGHGRRAGPRRLRLHPRGRRSSAISATPRSRRSTEGTSQIQKLVIAREVLK